MAMAEGRLFINNEYVESVHGETFNVLSPYNQAVSSTVHNASGSDVELAVKAASDALGGWRTTPSARRFAFMTKFADLVDEEAEKIAILESQCMGCPMMLAIGVVQLMAKSFRYYAGFVDKIKGESYSEDGDGFFKLVQKEPMGVCAGIAGWNATPIFAGFKIAPAVATGNTVIFKSSEKSPLGTLFLGNLIQRAGFPPGVINLLSGGAATGAMLASHMKIAHLSFTGSREAGRQVQIAAAKSNLKKVSLELGGKSAALVFDDADFDSAVAYNSQHFLLNSAQVCSAASRILVQEDIAERFISALRAAFLRLAEMAGDPSSKTTFLGPLADEEHCKRVRGYIENAENEGIEVLAGGSESPATGHFVRPTIFCNPPVTSAIYQEEVFGPVAVVRTFKTEEEAIDMANDSDFGLAGERSALRPQYDSKLTKAATVFTSNMQRALRVVGRLQVGMVAVNSTQMPLLQVPWGGGKESGHGREGGIAGLEEYLQTKTVLLSMK